jgi:hypothetical protein
LPTQFIIDGTCPPPYSLLDVYLKNNSASIPAGYMLNGSGMLYYEPNAPNSPCNIYKGLRHTYFIDRGSNNLNLNILNSVEKIIFNPSEVHIDPDAGDPSQNKPPIEVVFPEDYTFKTLLGRYPSLAEANTANLDPQNGGPFTYLKDAPVPVNASEIHPTVYNPDDYPEVMWDDPTTPLVNNYYDDERYGYYYIESKATLRISNCVKLFDCRFGVNPGGTLIFNNYPGIIQNEDKDNNFGRYKIRGEGGAILRNYAPVQYVQNGQIDQANPLEYIATWSIFSGNDVDPDTDQPTGDYNVLPGADVTFKAGSAIHLKDGFSVSGGNFHAFIEPNMAVPDQCIQSTRSMATSNQITPPNKTTSKWNTSIKLSPNPTTGVTKIEGLNNVNSSDILVYNTLGRRVFADQIASGSNEYLLDLNNFENGIYFVEVNSGGVVHKLKVVKSY